MDIFEAIYERRSIRVFDPTKKIPDNVKREILDAARYAPVSPDLMPQWRLLLLVEDKKVKELLGESAAETARIMFGCAFEVFSQHLWYMPEDTKLRVAEYTTTGELWKYPRDADMVVLPAWSRNAWTETILTFTPHYGLLGVYLGFALQNMWLIAASHGVGAAFNGMPLLDIRKREVFYEHLGIPVSWETPGAFCFGYPPAIRFFGPARPQLEGVVFSEYWGNPYEKVAFRKEKYETFSPPSKDVWDVIKSQCQYVTFSEGEKIDDLYIEKILDSAIWGPVPENYKHWRFVIVKDKESKEFIRKISADRIYRPLFSNVPEVLWSRLWYIEPEKRLEKIEREIERGYGKWFTDADTLIIVLCPRSLSWVDQPYTGLAFGHYAIHVATGCCIQNMMLAATALGLGINWDPIPYGEGRLEELFKEYFGLPETWDVVGVLSLGWPGEKAEEPPRPPLEEVVFKEYWGNPYKE